MEGKINRFLESRGRVIKIETAGGVTTRGVWTGRDGAVYFCVDEETDALYQDFAMGHEETIYDVFDRWSQGDKDLVQISDDTHIFPMERLDYYKYKETLQVYSFLISSGYGLNETLASLRRDMRSMEARCRWSDGLEVGAKLLNEFYTAAEKLTESWPEALNDHNRMYPFDKSFDEVTADIKLWYQNIKSLNQESI